MDMECLGPACASILLEWLKEQAGKAAGADAVPRQAMLWDAVPYQEDAPALRSARELAGAMEHLEYAIHRRFHNQLTRAERARLDNTIDNALFKVERYAARLEGGERERVAAQARSFRDTVREGRERVERLQRQAQRADLKLAQLGSLSPEQFEEFVAELFEALGFEVDRVGGTGDEGADLLLRRDGLRAIAQCKYHSKGVIGSPDLQKFLGAIQHGGGHKGFFVTTRTFSLAAERFAAEHPIELIDGPRLVELVQQALGPRAPREREPVWF
jgi:restriction system protein